MAAKVTTRKKLITSAAVSFGIVAALLGAGPANAQGTLTGDGNKFVPAPVNEFPTQADGYWGYYMCKKSGLNKARANAHGGFLRREHCK